MAEPSSPLPTISAVLATRGGEARLGRALESLCRQTLPREELEVVVVDDGSGDGTGEVARAFEARLPLRFAYQQPAGVASARNHGLFLARGLIVLFLDDDVADPALLERHVEAHRRFPEPRCAVVGPAVLEPSLASDPLMSFLDGPGALPQERPLAAGELLDWRHFRTGRSSCKRRFLLEKGTFNSAFRTGGEDAELAFRLSRKGFQVAYEPGAVVHVADALCVDDVCAQRLRRGRAAALVRRMHRCAEIEAWSGAKGASDAWRELAPAYDAIVRSARELDRIARLRDRHGMPLEDSERALLHRSYWAAFRASELKGLLEGAGEAFSAVA